MATGWPMKTTYANGDVYTAGDVNDITGTINQLGSSVAYAAGKNEIINGDFSVWQRGTTFSNPADASYTADRFIILYSGTGATRTISQQTFTPGTAPVAGYEGTFFYRYAISAIGTGNTYNIIDQRIENVRSFAGQTVTASFWAKADSARTVTLSLYQSFGSGGSADVNITGQNASLTTSWQRFTFTYSVPSISGKTIGTGSSLVMRFTQPFGVTMTLDYWGVQLEQGSTATAFQTATGTIQGELALCQRYFQIVTSGYAGQALSAGIGQFYVNLPVVMRIAPTATFPAAPFTNYLNELTVALRTPTTVAAGTTNTQVFSFTYSGATLMTPSRMLEYNGATIQLSAEI